MIDILSVLLGVVLGFCTTIFFTVFLLGWASGNIEEIKWAAERERARENTDNR